MAASRSAPLCSAKIRPYCGAQTKETLARRIFLKEADMTAQFLNASSPAVGERRVPQVLAALGRAWRQYRSYRQTQAELRALSIRQREDVGLAGADLEAVAREAVYKT
jgi:uncharacterized protein YjiS (DUF1127 family)